MLKVRHVSRRRCLFTQLTEANMKRLLLHIRSRRGVDGPLGFLVALPVWWLLSGLILVLGMWFWASAINIGAVSQGTLAFGVGDDGRTVASSFQAVGLGGWAGDYQAATQFAIGGRVVIGSVDKRTDTIFKSAPFFVVQSRSLARQEAFQPRAPVGGWE
jgi:hypothetical protein